MIDIHKLLKENGWYTWYGSTIDEPNWRHKDYPAELSVFDTKDALEALAFKKGFTNVNKFIKHLEEQMI